MLQPQPSFNFKKLFQQSLEIKDDFDDLPGKAVTINEMAKIYVTKGDLDEAMKMYQQSLKIFEGLGDLRGKAIAQSGIASIYVNHGDWEQGLKFQNEILKIN